MKVHTSFGEQFINWFPYHTKLYIRGERGKDWAETQKLYEELAKQLNHFYAHILKQPPSSVFSR